MTSGVEIGSYSALRQYSMAPTLGFMSGASAARQMWHGYVGVQQRGLVALPRQLRQRMHLDEPGAQLEITERDDGVFELRPVLPIPADQAWFWEDRWQEREREVEAHLAAGEVTRFDSTEDFLAYLDGIAEPPTHGNHQP